MPDKLIMKLDKELETLEFSCTPTIELKESGKEELGIITGVAGYPTYIKKYDAYIMDGALSGACGLKVPVIYQHAGQHPPFGEASFSCSVGSNKIDFTMWLDLGLIKGTETPIYPLAHQSYHGYKTKKIKGVSMGLEILKHHFNDKNEMMIEEAVPFELSVTPWPAIEGAVAKRVLTRNNDNEVVIADDNNQECPCAVALVAKLEGTLRRLSDG